METTANKFRRALRYLAVPGEVSCRPGLVDVEFELFEMTRQKAQLAMAQNARNLADGLGDLVLDYEVEPTVRRVGRKFEVDEHGNRQLAIWHGTAIYRVSDRLERTSN